MLSVASKIVKCQVKSSLLMPLNKNRTYELINYTSLYLNGKGTANRPFGLLS